MNLTQLGKYKLVEQLGKGGFGTVYKATDPIGRTVAIKVLKPGWVDDPGVMARFRLEALAAGELFHTRIATILDFVEMENQPFLVMRYVDGQSLDKLLAAKGRLDWNSAIRIIKEVAEGLDFAHQRGFIHRDIKPANILVSEKEGAVLTDFGLVKAAQASGLSSSEVLLGSPNYIAPEVWKGVKASPATDIYSLACVFYEMITGKILFAGDSSPQIMTRHVLEGPQFPRSWPEKVPPDVEGVLHKALMMEPGKRYPSASAFASALEELQHLQNQQPGEYINTIVIESRQREKLKRRFHPIWPILGLILIGILAGGLILVNGNTQHKALPVMPIAGSFTPSLTRMIPTPTVVNTLTRTHPPPTNTRPLPSSTITFSPTPIPSTSTPTQSLPVLAGTSIPLPDLPISADNAQLVTQLARLGKGAAGLIAWSPDGDQIALAHSLGVYLYDAQSLQQIDFIDMPVRILSLAYSPDGTQLAISRSDHTIQLIQVTNGNVLQTLTADMDVVRCVAFTLDGEYLVSGEANGVIQIWRLADSIPIRTRQDHQSAVTDIAISPKGQIMASGSTDNTIRIWNILDGSLLTTLSGHVNSVNRVAFSPDGKYLASASSDLTARIWEVTSGRQLVKFYHKDAVYSVAFSPDGKILATASYDKIIRLWHSDNGSRILEMTGHQAAINHITFLKDGKTLASISEDGTLGLWQVEDGQMLRKVEVATGLVRSVTFSANSEFVAAGTRNGTVQLWDLADASEMDSRLVMHGGQVNALFAIPGNVNIASGSDDNAVKIWTPAGQEILNVAGITNHIESVAVSPDGLLLAAGSYDGSVYIWKISDGMRLKTLKESQSPIWSVSFSPNNAILAAASLDGWVHTWNTDDWSRTELAFTPGKENPVFSLAFSPDNKYIAFSYGNSGIIQLHRISDGELLFTLEEHTGEVWSMCFSPNSQVLVSGSLDGTIRLWKISDGSTLNILQEHLNSISNVACSPDGKFIASGSWDGTMRIWGIAP
jgi:WD40 repeat protein